MKHYLSSSCFLKSLERPCAYDIRSDELYELDSEAFAFLKKCSSPRGAAAGKNSFVSYCLKEGILTTEPSPAIRPPVRKSPSPSLRYLELQITDRCNLRCRHCYIGRGTRSELNAREIQRILREFEAMQGLRVLVTGGEPLTHSRWDYVNSLLPGFALRKILFTNGTLLTKKRLKALSVNEIQISIDGIEASHDMVRGVGSYRRAMRGMSLALEAGFDVSVSTMIFRHNLGDMNKMESLFRDMGVREWTVDVPSPAGRLKDNIGLAASAEDCGSGLSYGFGGGGIHGGGGGFACGTHLMAVTSRGKCAKCSFYADSPAGSIDEGLRACRQRLKPISIASLECSRLGCPGLEACRGGCRFRASVSGDASGVDPYRCALYKRFSGATIK